MKDNSSESIWDKCTTKPLNTSMCHLLLEMMLHGSSALSALEANGALSLTKANENLESEIEDVFIETLKKLQPLHRRIYSELSEVPKDKSQSEIKKQIESLKSLHEDLCVFSRGGARDLSTDVRDIPFTAWSAMMSACGTMDVLGTVFWLEIRKEALERILQEHSSDANA